jgi:hypothetical protein
MSKKINEMKPEYVVFSILPHSMLRGSLVQQSNTFESLEDARGFADRHNGTCYVFQQVEQHYKKPSEV